MVNVGGKGSFEAPANSRFLVMTPGGGGYGDKRERQIGESDHEGDEMVVVGGSLNQFRRLQEQC